MSERGTATEATEQAATPTTDRVRDELRDVVDPCTAATGSNLDIVEMGLVKAVDVDDGAVHVDMRLTTPACHMVPYFITEIEDRVAPLGGVESVTVETDAGMEWTADMMTETAREKRAATLDRYEAALEHEDASAE
jgi:metal-sulfur cluster biosynthetic enzyme